MQPASEQSVPAPPIALAVAGFDPSAGAGVLADLKTFAAHRVYGMAALTAITVQSTLGVKSVEPLPPALLRETLDGLAADVVFAAIKIGMLGTGAVVRVLTGFLGTSPTPRSHVVLDPVLRSSSGAMLLDAEGLALLRTELLARVGIITPNVEELGALTGTPLSPSSIDTPEAIETAAACLQSLARAEGNDELSVVVTGGHLPHPHDYLLPASAARGTWFSGVRVATRSTHGTGCTYSSALAAQLALGTLLPQAAALAKVYVTEALRRAQPIGGGRGPLHHHFELNASGPDRR